MTLEDLETPNPIARVGRSATELIDNCREVWGDDIQLGDVIIVAEVLLEDSDEQIYREVVSLSSEDRAYVTAGLLRKAADLAEQTDAEEKDDA